MANETYHKPYGCTFNSVTITKCERVQAAEAAQGRPRYGDNATWPTVNRRHLRNARITLTTFDHAAYDSISIGDAGTLAFTVLVEKTGSTAGKSWANLIVTDKNRGLAGEPEACQIVFEVESSDGAAGPWS